MQNNWNKYQSQRFTINYTRRYKLQKFIRVDNFESLTYVWRASQAKQHCRCAVKMYREKGCKNVMFTDKRTSQSGCTRLRQN